MPLESCNSQAPNTKPKTEQDKLIREAYLKEVKLLIEGLNSKRSYHRWIVEEKDNGIVLYTLTRWPRLIVWGIVLPSVGGWFLGELLLHIAGGI